MRISVLDTTSLEYETIRDEWIAIVEALPDSSFAKLFPNKTWTWDDIHRTATLIMTSDGALKVTIDV